MSTSVSERLRRRRTALGVTGLVLIGLSMLLLASYRRDIRGAHARLASGSSGVQTDCGTIEFAAAGEGTPVLVVHGSGGDHDQGLDMVAPLSDSGFRIIALSTFGYLGTPLPSDASAAAPADAHACLLDALDIERVPIIDGSAGAPSAMQFAPRHPDRISALLLLVPAAYARRNDDEEVTMSPVAQFLFATALRSDFLFWLANKISPDTLIEVLLATPPEVVKAADLDEQQRVKRVLDQIMPVSQRRSGLLNDVAISTSVPRYDLEQIKAPTLAVSVGDDLFGTFESARYTAEHIPGGRFIGYPSGGHIWAGHHQDLMNAFAEFLRENP